MGASDRDIMSRMAALREPPQEAAPEPEAVVEEVAADEVPSPTPEVTAEAEEPAGVSAISLAPGDEPVVSDGESVPTIETAEDLAEYLDLPLEDLYRVTVPSTDSDGNRVELSLGELKDVHQANANASAAATKRAAELEQLKSEAVAEQSRHNELIEARVLELQATLQAAERQSMVGLEDATLERMKAEGDPDYGTALAERMRKEQQLREVRASAVAQVERLREEREQQQTAYMDRLKVAERQALLDTPGFESWRDPKAYDENSQRVVQYALSQGFTEQDVNQIVNSKVVALLEKARLYDESKKAGAVARKQVIKVGQKVAKPGATQSKARTRSTELDGARKALRKSGHINDAVGLLRAKRQAN